MYYVGCLPVDYVSLEQVLGDEIETHIDAGHNVAVPYQGVCEVASKQGGGWGERYVGCRAECEISVIFL